MDAPGLAVGVNVARRLSKLDDEPLGEGKQAEGDQLGFPGERASGEMTNLSPMKSLPLNSWTACSAS